MSGPSGNDVLREASRMMSDCLLETEGLSHLTEDEIMSRLEITRMAITGVLRTSSFLSDDGFAFCKALGFDLGISVRKPDGMEFTFYPARNFGPDSVQSSPRPAKQEVPSTPPTTSVPPRLPSVLLPAPASSRASALPFVEKRRNRPIGFIQQFLNPTPKAETADPEASPLPGINEYEV